MTIRAWIKRYVFPPVLRLFGERIAGAIFDALRLKDS